MNSGRGVIIVVGIQYLAARVLIGSNNPAKYTKSVHAYSDAPRLHGGTEQVRIEGAYLRKNIN